MNATPILQRRMTTRTTFFAFLLIWLIAVLALPASATTVNQPSTGMRLTVRPDGVYMVTTSKPAWAFGGDIGEPLHKLAMRSGNDGVGEYREIEFRYDEGGARKGSIRIYKDRQVVLFTVTYLDAAKNAAPFPQLSDYPRGLNHLSYDGQFGVYTFDKLGSDSPWIFFNSAANAFVLSPASHFLQASTVWSDRDKISAGIDPRITDLPKGFQQSTMLVVAPSIHQAFDTFGHAMTDLQGKVRPANDADTMLRYLGYWTDNGATYYYKFEPALGYAGTMLGVRDDFRRQGIPLGYLQLDSWFYPKGPKAEWRNFTGIYEYVADKSLFPAGLKAFQAQLGLPLVIHARWIDPSSPYHQQYQMSGNVVIDPKYWDSMTARMADAGVVTYEQDWLDKNAEPEFNLTDPDAYLDNMANACSQHKVTMQYCMPLPRHYLQSSKYSNLTAIRTSGDRFNREKWDQFLYDSRLANVLGAWPWCDVFMSSETANLVLATLSAGPVGVGDAIGALDKANLMRVVRSDGVIVKPDVSIAPTDESFMRDAQKSGHPMVATTYTDFGALHAAYVFAYPRSTGGAANRSISLDPEALGFRGSVYIYEYLAGTGRIVTAEPLTATISGDYGYYIVVPVGKSGIGFLGDAGQWVTLGKQRIASLTDDGVVHATVTFAKGEGPRTLFGYAPSLPIVTASDGSAAPVTYDAASHLFHVVVTAGADGMAKIEIKR